ncbi:MAG: hypothetical protein KGJ36_06250, partial [Acidobacteriota bacterium]|nr:hypothetical protein [Acidobacteriota bacterium]
MLVGKDHLGAFIVNDGPQKHHAAVVAHRSANAFHSRRKARPCSRLSVRARPSTFTLDFAPHFFDATRDCYCNTPATVSVVVALSSQIPGVLLREEMPW